jgi:hypothetical protein
MRGFCVNARRRYRSSEGGDERGVSEANVSASLIELGSLLQEC